ncbi:hypothetical protein ACOSP7_022755 [Xanthoceras sorbifolium]
MKEIVSEVAGQTSFNEVVVVEKKKKVLESVYHVREEDLHRAVLIAPTLPARDIMESDNLTSGSLLIGGEGLLTCTGLLNLAGSSSIEVYGLGSHMRGDTLIQGVHDSVHVLMNLEVQIVHGVHELHELCEVSIHAAILDIDAVSSSSHHKVRWKRISRMEHSTRHDMTDNSSMGKRSYRQEMVPGEFANKKGKISTIECAYSDRVKNEWNFIGDQSSLQSVMDRVTACA